MSTLPPTLAHADRNAGTPAASMPVTVEIPVSEPGRGAKPLRRLSVSNKLLLIYLLDLITVIFISSVLIHEKYIAIDFSRKELQGAAYIDALRPTMIGLASPLVAAPSAELIAELADIERRAGEGMQSADLNQGLRDALQSMSAKASAEAPDAPAIEAARSAALKVGSELITRVGNQSNLILDPDLDTYYTMSLVLLRYPALLSVVSDAGPRLRLANGDERISQADRARLYALVGELDAILKSMASDYSEAIAAARDPLLAAALAPLQEHLAGATGSYLDAARRIASDERLPMGELAAREKTLISALDATWATGDAQLGRLIDSRVHDFFVRMWLHLGASLTLLTIILFAVFYVARQISRPLRQLWHIVDTVRRTGNHDLRARWDSEDEIGRLVVGFNDMMAQMDSHRRAQQELAATARAAEAQQKLLEVMPVALMVTSIPEHRVLHANAPAQQWLGEHAEDPWAFALERDARRRFFQELSDRERVDEFEVRWRGAEASAWAVLSARRLDYQGSDSVVTVFTPFNRLKALEQRLELWAKVFEASSEGIVLLDGEGHVVTANSAFCRAGGLDPSELVNEPLDCVRIADDSRRTSASAIWQSAASRGWWRGEVLVTRLDETVYPAWAAVTAIRDASGKLTHYILTCLDISDRKARDEQVNYLAHHDSLTGLPNRGVAEQRLREAIARCSDGSGHVAALFIDLDRFKNINDSLGHPVGDELLRQVATRLRSVVRNIDTVSRFGGDEFVVVLDSVTGRAEVDSIAERLLHALREPYAIGTLELRTSCSIGLAVFPEDAPDLEQLMRHADAAMYEAKSAGRDSIRHFTADLSERAQQRLRIELLLRNAVARNEFSLVFQPQVRTGDGSMFAVEALLRWYTPELGQVSPELFIPIAEESRLILEIGEWVLDNACRQMAVWRNADVDIATMSVNLSAVQLLDPAFTSMLTATLERHRLPASSLELELTESTLMEGAGKRLERLYALKTLGVALAIDDFGTGYSSLSYLSRLPTTKVKIDRSLTVGLTTDPKNRAITEAIIALAHRLEMTVVAEGVETAEMLALLRAARCDAVQGYYVTRPMPADAFAHWLAQRDATSTGATQAESGSNDDWTVDIQTIAV